MPTPSACLWIPNGTAPSSGWAKSTAPRRGVVAHPQERCAVDPGSFKLSLRSLREVDVDVVHPGLALLPPDGLVRGGGEQADVADLVVHAVPLRNADGDLRPVVQVRLAHLLIDTGKAKDALALLGDERNAAMLDARGDAQFSLGDFAKAQDDYRKALALVDVGSPQHHLITMKLIEAGGVPPHSEDKR